MIQLPLTTASERSAALLALHAYVLALDGADPFNRPDVGAPVQAPVPARAPAITDPVVAFPPMPAPVPVPVPVPAPVPEAERELVKGTADYAVAVLDGQHEVDSAGQKWDPEIHSSTKSKTQDGQWRKRKSTATPVVPMPPAAPAVVAEVPLPPVAPAPAIPMPMPMPPATVASVVDATMRLIMSGKKTPQELHAIYAECGVTTGVAGLPAMPEKAAEIMAKLEAL